MLFWAVLEAVNIAAVKPATVRRNWAGTDYTIDCYVSQHVKDEYQAGNIVIGDYVLVEALDWDPDKMGVLAKVYKTW
ncbi:MAG: hypothetical protein V3U31_02485 [Dehalococcoidia bacterium]